MARTSTLSPIAALEERNLELQRRLDEVLAAVEEHLDDPHDDADARLYRRVFGARSGDFRVDDPNDWPDP
jgi:hypothetical protein